MFHFFGQNVDQIFVQKLSPNFSKKLNMLIYKYLCVLGDIGKIAKVSKVNHTFAPHT